MKLSSLHPQATAKTIGNMKDFKRACPYCKNIISSKKINFHYICIKCGNVFMKPIFININKRRKQKLRRILNEKT